MSNYRPIKFHPRWKLYQAGEKRWKQQRKLASGNSICLYIIHFSYYRNNQRWFWGSSKCYKFSRRHSDVNILSFLVPWAFRLEFVVLKITNPVIVWALTIGTTFVVFFSIETSSKEWLDFFTMQSFFYRKHVLLTFIVQL